MHPDPSPDSRSDMLTWAALAVAVAISAVSVWFSTGGGLVACPLCYYQRTFAFAAAGLYAVGLTAGLGRRAALSLLALPAAAAGAGVAAFHVWLVETGKLECPAGLFKLGTVPHQSLVAFALLLLVMACDLTGRLPSGRDRLAALLAVALGGLLVGASALSVPPPPKAQPNAGELKTCRPPYRE